MDGKRTTPVGVFNFGIQNKNPPHKVKMKMGIVTNPGQPRGMDEVQLWGLNKVKGPVANDDVELKSPTLSNETATILQNAIIHKDKAKQQTQPLGHGLGPSQAGGLPQCVGIKPKTACQPEIIGIKPKKTLVGLQLVQEKSPLVTLHKPFKRRLDARDAPVPSRQGGMREKKEVMEMTKAFNECTLADSKEVIFDHKEMTPGDMNEHSLMNLPEPFSSGSFGVVHKIPGHSSNHIAIKEVLKKSGVPMDHNEILIPFELQHPGIVRMFGVKCNPERYWIMMEYAGRSLKTWLTYSEEFKTYIRDRDNHVKFCLALYKIVRWLENHHTSHRDIKFENFGVLEKEGGYVPTLIDFGSAQTSLDKPGLAAHTPEYLPPVLNKLIKDIRNGKQVDVGDLFFTEKSDVYGVSMMDLSIWLGGRHPIQQVNNYSSDPVIFQDQRCCVMNTIINMNQGFYEPFLRHVLEPLKTVLRNTLCLDAQSRWNATRVCRFLEGDIAESCAKKVCVSVGGDTDELANFFDNMLQTPQKAATSQQQKPTFQLVLKKPQILGMPVSKFQMPAESRMAAVSCLKMPAHAYKQQAPPEKKPANAVQPAANLGLFNVRPKVVGIGGHRPDPPCHKTTGNVPNFSMTGQKTVGNISHFTVPGNKMVGNVPNVDPVGYKMAGNIPNMDFLDTCDGPAVKPKKVVLGPGVPQTLDQGQATQRQEDVCLVPNLDMLEFGDGDQPRPIRKIIHGKRRSSANKTHHC